MPKPGAEGNQQNENQPGADENENKNTNQSGGEADPPPSEDSGEIPEELKDPSKAFKLIQDLRKENAKHRTKNNELASKVSGMEGTLKKLKGALGGEDEDIDPEEALKKYQQQTELLQVELGITQLAREHGISKEEDEFFRFLLSKRFEELQEGEELSEEDIAPIVEKVRKLNPKNGTANNSTGLNKGNTPPPSGGKSGVTAAQFAKMSTVEKSQLFTNDRASYDRLFNEANEKGLL